MDEDIANIASEGTTPVQVGRVYGRRSEPADTTPDEPRPGGVTNIVSDNARVGCTADVVYGGVIITQS